MNLAQTMLRMQEAGVGKVEFVEHHADPGAIVWSPGDGYRYTLILQHLPEPLMLLVGGSNQHVLATYYNGVKAHSWAFCDGATHTVDYVAHRMGIDPNQSTAAYLTALLNMAIGNFDYGHGIYTAAKERWA